MSGFQLDFKGIFTFGTTCLFVLMTLALCVVCAATDARAQSGAAQVEQKAFGDVAAPDINMPEPKQDEDNELWGVDSAMFISLSDDLQDLLLKEVEKVYNDCAAKGLYSRLHDCRCISVRFMDQRLRAGPDFNRNRLLDKIGAKCPNPAETAGYAYTECMGVQSHSRYENKEEYCECFGNNVARFYANRPIPHYAYYSKVSVAAYQACYKLIKN